MAEKLYCRMMKQYEPGYLQLACSGELEKRIQALEKKLNPCTVCPRECGVDRINGHGGFCHAGYEPYISSICDHHGEEPALSGRNGSGTVFFGSCNLRCVFCQNYEISQTPEYYSRLQMPVRELALRMVHLQNDLGVHNINFVSPSHFVPQMVAAISDAAGLGLKIPIVYNSNGYDGLETLKLLDGVIDIYLPDFKYFDDQPAREYSSAPTYNTHARAALKEMYRQVGNLQVDEQGIAQRGLLIRHLVLPNDLADTEQVLKWIADELSPDVTVSLMAQYHPTFRAGNFALLSRPITWREYQRALKAMEKAGLKDGYTQQMDAPEHYLPDFMNEGHPFER
jgi:putative pyruvate formate lyase activating enzyme